MGKALYRAAMQADRKDMFRERITDALSAYEKAKEAYEKLNDKARTIRCRTQIAYLGYWLATDASRKKEFANDAWTRTKESLRAFREGGNGLEFVKTYLELSGSAILGLYLAWDSEAFERAWREGAELGSEAIRFATSYGNTNYLATTYVRTSGFLWSLAYCVEGDEGETLRQRGREYWRKALETSELIALRQLNEPFAVLEFSVPQVDWDRKKLAKISEVELEYRRKTRDKLAVGWILEGLQYHNSMIALGAEDPDEKLELLERALKYAEEARHEYSPLSFSGRSWVTGAKEGYYLELSRLETDLERRRGLLEKALEASPSMLREAEESGNPATIQSAHRLFSNILASLAMLDATPGERKRLLIDALDHLNEAVKIGSQSHPRWYWYNGAARNHLASVKSQIAELAEDAEYKRNLLAEAIQDTEAGLKLAKRDLELFERRGPEVFAIVGKWQNEYGYLLNRLHQLTGDREPLRKASEAFLKAAESFRKLNHPSRVAECYWQAAQANDALEDHLKASELFLMASGSYSLAAEKIPQLKNVYDDHALYMRAWSEVETARHHHAKQEYDSARISYLKAAELHKSTRDWKFLAGNYLALAEIEKGEDLSRKEQSQEALRSFQQAAELFINTSASLQAELNKIRDQDKRQLVASLVRGSYFRHEYSEARMALEEAKLLDRKGDHYSSAEKYGQAAETFEEIAQSVEFEQARREVRLIAILSKAWQMMSRAEEETSPELYLEASDLFEKARELSPNEKTRSLALGHSRFCRALEAGTRFADSGDEKLHSSAIQLLESSSKYYLKAGFEDAAEYAAATELLFDAYLRMAQAKSERDDEKKAKLYALAEKLLEKSTQFFDKAQHPARRDWVLRFLEKVRRERELALSLMEVLHAPSFISATSSFSPPTAKRERPIGLDKFQHADIQASLITRQASLKVGEDLDLEIELVNAGRGPAQLIKVEELIPDGFEITKKPEPYRIENSYLNMKGRRLDPLKTEEVKLVLRPNSKGNYTIKPRILYLDESGSYKIHEPEPVEVTVKELGFTGWVKGR